MYNKLWKVLLASPAVLGMGVASSAVAATEATGLAALEANETSVQLAQVSTIDELRDVAPTDWAFQALRSLVEDYACIEGDLGTQLYRGSQFMTRYEFAAGLNKCLDSIRNILGNPDVIDPADLATLQRLQDEFAAELATLRGRVDALEAETAELRSQQFSTTTKLRGQVDFHVVVPFDELNTIYLNPELDTAITGSDDTATFVSRASLNFDASLTGNDRLRVRLRARDGNALDATVTGLANGGGDQNGEIRIDDFYYQFGLGESLDFTIAARSVLTNDFVTSTIVPFDGPSVADAGGPLFYDFDMGGGGFGAGVSFGLGDTFVIDAGYSGATGASGTNDNNDGGIFGANEQSYIVQASFLTDGFLDAGVAYLHGNNGVDNDFTDTFAGLLNLDFGGFFVAGHFAFHDDGNDDDTSWQVGAGFSDFLFEGSEVGVYYADLPDYDQNPYVIEGYWQVPVNRFLSLTPAIIYGNLDSGGNDDNFYGALRATFKF
jgi:hypothetical protein